MRRRISAHDIEKLTAFPIQHGGAGTAAATRSTFFAEPCVTVIEGGRSYFQAQEIMLSHVTVGVKDVEQARRFYGPILDALGLKPRFGDARWAGWQPSTGDRPLFVVTQPFDGEQPTDGNGQMIALMAGTRAIVDQCHALALGLGGTDAGEPGVRAHYHPNYYGAYFRDPDGNKLCVCCHLPE